VLNHPAVSEGTVTDDDIIPSYADGFGFCEIMSDIETCSVYYINHVKDVFTEMKNISSESL
jgi:hypothetical protein